MSIEHTLWACFFVSLAAFIGYLFYRENQSAKARKTARLIDEEIYREAYKKFLPMDSEPRLSDIEMAAYKYCMSRYGVKECDIASTIIRDDGTISPTYVVDVVPYSTCRGNDSNVKPVSVVVNTQRWFLYPLLP